MRGAGSSSTSRLDCRRALALVLDDLESEIDGGSDEAAAARGHVQACPGCRAEATRELLVLTGLHRLGDLVQSMELPEASWTRVLARLEEDGGRRPTGSPGRGRVRLPRLGSRTAVGLDTGRALAPLLAIAVVLPVLLGGIPRPVALTGGVVAAAASALPRRLQLGAGTMVRGPRLGEEAGGVPTAGVTPAVGTGSSAGARSGEAGPVRPPDAAPARPVPRWADDGNTAGRTADGSGATDDPGDVSPGRGAGRSGLAASPEAGPQAGPPAGLVPDPAAAGEALVPRSDKGSLPRRD